MSSLYDRFVLPRLVNLACSTRPAMRQRAKVVPQARGRVLEIGIGSGLNLAYYDAERVEAVWGLEPSEAMTAMAAEAASRVDFPVHFVAAGSEEIPLDDASFDTVVMTYTLCTIPDPELGLREMARALGHGGRLLFCEHGAAPDGSVRAWQDRITPVWKRFAGGCHLNRDIAGLIRAAGFAIETLETMYIPGWRPACFNTWGSALVSSESSR